MTASLHLEGLYLASNRFEGSIPEYTHLPRLNNLYLYVRCVGGGVPCH